MNTKTAPKKRSPRKRTAPSQVGCKPTQLEREIVTGMISAGVTTEIARKLVLNKSTGKPYARSTFWKHFKTEIETGGKSVTGKAVATLVRAMDDVTKSGQTSTTAVRAAEFWLKTRESDLFSERRINENIETQTASELSKIDSKQSRRIAENVLAQINGENRLKPEGQRASIDDDAVGSA